MGAQGLSRKSCKSCDRGSDYARAECELLEIQAHPDALATVTVRCKRRSTFAGDPLLWRPAFKHTAGNIPYGDANVTAAACSCAAAGYVRAGAAVGGGQEGGRAAVLGDGVELQRDELARCGHECADGRTGAGGDAGQQRHARSRRQAPAAAAARSGCCTATAPSCTA